MPKDNSDRNKKIETTKITKNDIFKGSDKKIGKKKF
jgi:hypothetical protein